MKELVDFIQAFLSFPIVTDLKILLSILLFGITIGSYIGKREANKNSSPFIQRYMTQKDEMWDEIKKLIPGV